ncbi:DUF1887 family protein [Mangrovimonas sp. TPBH4]|uniref:DUF1887 family protein n=1 Tax=Mangrovimonas sp. TPBH4 TaxID=1645914 RepID=UPI0006B46461|nr:DUF1887 family protein [Mangrovimonas sp. TPBH4]
MSKSILISLIGKETIHNYRAYKEFAPDVLVHVYSEESKTSEAILANLVQPYTQLIPVKVDANNFYGILETLEAKVTIAPSDYVTINLTGGTKMMALASYAFANALKVNHSVRKCYIDLDQNIRWFEEENQFDTFTEQLTLDELIALSGQKLYKNQQYDSIYPLCGQALSEIEPLIYSKNWKKFLENVVTPCVKEYDKRKGKEPILKIAQRLQSNGAFNFFDVFWEDSTFKVLKDGTPFLALDLSVGNVSWLIFFGGYFELMVAKAYAQHYPSKDIYLSVIFPALSNQKQEKNEVDVLINDGGKLLFIECKSGRVSSANINTIKVRKETYGGLIGQSVLVTRFPLNKNVTHDQFIIEKCKELDVSYTTLEKIKNENSFS